MSDTNRPEPPPKHTGGRPIWDLVMDDMRMRDAVGRAKYGTPLQAHNGRDALVDAYQEALDLAVYLRQAIEERAGTRAAERTYSPIRCPRCSAEMQIVAGGSHASCSLRACGEIRLSPTADTEEFGGSDYP